jgi:hypothetical protein
MLEKKARRKKKRKSRAVSTQLKMQKKDSIFAVLIAYE